MTGFLAKACAEARERVAAAARDEPLPALRERALAQPAPPPFAAALTGSGVAVIAEVKRSSPSRGAIAEIPDASALARRYAAGGAVAVSVLTEPAHFGGSLGDLAAVAGAVPLPVLRKDFVVDAYQVFEARASGAAAVLLIVAGLPDSELVQLLRVTAEAGLDALVEVHDRAEALRAAAATETAGTGWPLVAGVNARDLTTLEVDPGRFAAVRGSLPEATVTVAESGVHGPEDVRRLAGLGADAVLVGEHVATAADPTGAVRALVTAGARQQEVSR
jgi:indole-3-glycerol phosphate synthase